jgi:hypothetical protein
VQAGLFGPNAGTGNYVLSEDYNTVFSGADAWIGVGAHDLATDPLLDAQFVPSPCSPTIDAGDPDPFVDYSLEPAPNGGRVNMGHLGGTSSAVPALPDVDGDRIVDGIDILRIGTSFASGSGEPRYLPGADLVADGIVDGLDLAAASLEFGTECP